jgi:hypothetical protein
MAMSINSTQLKKEKLLGASLLPLLPVQLLRSVVVMLCSRMMERLCGDRRDAVRLVLIGKEGGWERRRRRRGHVCLSILS